MIPKGTYTAKAISAEFGKSGNKGTDMVSVYLDVEGQGKITYFGYFTEATSERTIESLRTLGCTFPDNRVTNLTGLGTNKVSIVVDHEDYEGKPRARVKWINPISGLKEENKMSDSAKSSLDARMKNLVLAGKPRTAPPSAQVEYEDLPF